MGWQVVHDDDVAGLEGGNQHLLDPRQEYRPVHRAIEHHRAVMPPSLRPPTNVVVFQ